MTGALYTATLITALGCGLAAGSLFPFSTFAMAGLKRLAAPEGIAAMQSINVRAVTPAFMTVLFGTALAGVIVAVWSLVASGDQPVAWTIAGAVVYLVGIPGITVVCNVPLNNRLERLNPRDPAATGVWNEYVAKWTAYNHARVITGLAAAALFTIALTQ